MKATLVSETGFGTVKIVLIENSLSNSTYDQYSDAPDVSYRKDKIRKKKPSLNA